MSQARPREELAPEDSVQRVLQQVRTALTRMSAQLGLGEVTWDEHGSTFEYGGHTVRARKPESGRAIFVGRDGRDTLYAWLSPGVFRSDSGTIVMDFTPVIRGEVEALVREVRA